MTVKNYTEVLDREKVEDDMMEETNEKLAMLRAKIKKQQEERGNNMAAKIVAKKERTLRLGIVGSGQAGSRLCEAFYTAGYEDVVAINTAQQDLKGIEIPTENKLHLLYGVGGAAKMRGIGEAACIEHRDKIVELINNKLSESVINVLAFSAGGGSGSGSAETLVDILSQTGKPLCVICVLPMTSDDTIAKNNSVETLSLLSKLIQEKKVNNLILVDNAKIEVLYSQINQMDFFDTANKAIVDNIDAFNIFSSIHSKVKSLDGMEWSKLLVGCEGLSIFGQLTISENYEDETAIAQSIISSLNNNLLAEGFDLKGCSSVGFIVCANANVWSKINASSINYASTILSDICDNPDIFKGIYQVESPENNVKIFTMFAGLGLPTSRIEQLKVEAKELQIKAKAKDQGKNLTLQANKSGSDAVSQAQKIRDKIAQKGSAFGKLLGNSIKK